MLPPPLGARYIDFQLLTGIEVVERLSAQKMSLAKEKASYAHSAKGRALELQLHCCCTDAMRRNTAVRYMFGATYTENMRMVCVQEGLENEELHMKCVRAWYASHLQAKTLPLLA